MKTHTKLLLALGLGSLMGITTHHFDPQSSLASFDINFLAPIGQVFLRLIFMIVVPMVFSGLVLGVLQLGGEHGLGSVVRRTLFYTIISSTASVLIGVALVATLRPGIGLQLPADALATKVEALAKVESNVANAKPFVQSLLEIIPKNPIDSAARALDGEMLALMFFALIFGMALAIVRKEEPKKVDSLVSMLEALYETCMKVVDFAMKLAPVAVFCLVFSSTYKFGGDLFISLIKYMSVVILGLAIQQFGVYSFMLKFLGKRSPIKFFKDCWDTYIYAFATASSNATLPKSLEVAEHTLKLNPAVSRFVLTVGSTANQNGTALFEGITVLFLAQVYGIELSVASQFQVVIMSVLAGIGTAGVPGGSLPLIMILLRQVGIPAEGLGIILGVDRLLDMCRTTINVSGDLVIAALVDQKTTHQ